MAASALIVCVPEAEWCVARWRECLDPSARLGVPAHITLLHPFMCPERISLSIVKQVSDFAASVKPFSFRLADVRRFPGVLCLDPEPVAAFVALTKRLVELFPDYPPYGGQYDSVIPHLTVARAGEAELSTIESQLNSVLSSRPVTATCSEMVLIENSAGFWKVMHTFSLGHAPRADA